MKTYRRWPRIILALIYLSIVIAVTLRSINEFGSNNISSIPDSNKGGVVFGLSLTLENPQSFFSDQASDNTTNWSTSFLLQSQSPINKVFLDYIAIYDNAPDDTYCFTSFRLSKDPSVPYEIIYSFDNETELGQLENQEDQPDEYSFRLNEPLCINKGVQFFLPHIFVGVVRSEASANILVKQITGRQALEFFPFEKQVINFNLSSHYIDDSIEYNLPTNLDISITQPGWLGSLSESTDQTALTLTRPWFYKTAVLVFFLVMTVLIIYLNNIVDDAGGFFEISFGLLLGLWGTHEILIPNYIASSIPIDVLIYMLYAFVICEMVAVSIDEFFIATTKRKVKIVKIVKGDVGSERVVIENPSLFPVDMTGWLLFDQAQHKFKFPVYVLPGRNLFTNVTNTVTVWTKDEKNDKSNLHWGRKQPVWNNDQETAYLEDSKGETIHNSANLVMDTDKSPK